MHEGHSVEWTALRLLTKQMFRQKKHVRNILARAGTDKERFSRWDLYNAVTDYATHGERLKPHVESWLHGKAQEIMKTTFNDLVDVERSKVATRVSG